MKIKILSFLLLLPFWLLAQTRPTTNDDVYYISKASLARIDSSKSLHPKEHYLFIGANVNYLTLNSSLNRGYEGAMGSGYYYGNISNMHSMLPGFQVNYISYHILSPNISFYNGEGFVYYHNEFTYNLIYNGAGFLGIAGRSGYELDTTITTVNSKALFIHYVAGFQINLPLHLYINLAIEPQLLLISNQQPESYSATSYDSTNQVISRSTSNSFVKSTISVFNINATIGIGYTLFASKPHSINIEFNFSPNIFNSPNLFVRSDYGNLLGLTFHRYTLELNVGVKL